MESSGVIDISPKPDVSHVKRFNLVRGRQCHACINSEDMLLVLLKCVTMINVIIWYAYTVIYLFN